MFHIVNPEAKFDFMSKSPMFSKVSITAFIIALALILLPIPGVGLKFGLDFSGGHEILVSIEGDKATSANVRAAVSSLKLGDTAVQSFEIPDTTAKHFLIRVQRSETFGQDELAGLNKEFKAAYGDKFTKLTYNPEAGDVIRVAFTDTATVNRIDTSKAALTKVVEKTEHKVRTVRKEGRPDELKFAIALKGIDVSVIDALKKEVDSSAKAEAVGFVGPTVGKQLRDDGILAMFYALLCILIYIALRFDFFYSPGAIVCLFHDAIITCGILSLLGHEFSLATIAGLLTLIGYSINDTIVIYDRIRERVGKAQGAGLKDVLNRAINETLGRTLMTSLTTGFACICLMFFGRNTVLFDFGLIMGIGVIIGTYSSVYVASPTFWALRNRFGQQPVTATTKKAKGKGAAKSAA